MKPDYDSTVARIAGNIAGHLIADARAAEGAGPSLIAELSVRIARAIIAEVKATTPKSPEPPR